MKPTQFEIILNYLQKGIEIFAIYKRTDSLGIEIDGFANSIRQNDKYYCLIREIRSDNHRDYFEDNFYDKNEETIFEKVEDLIEFIKINTGLNLDNFAKAKNDIHYRH